jgi:hypothetical protein
VTDESTSEDQFFVRRAADMGITRAPLLLRGIPVMKLASVLLGSVSIVLGIAACAAPADEPENTGSTAQALCPRGQICQVPKTTWYGGTSSGDFGVLDPGTSSSGGTTGTNACDVQPSGTFTCSGPVPSCGTVSKTTTEGCDLTVRCTELGCDCIPGCGGGSWGFGSWNPCMYGRTYRCDPSGYCTCS